MAERKIFGRFKNIPVVGYGYGLVRGIAYGLAGDENEAKHSFEMDLAILNGIISLVSNLDKNIWIGKRIPMNASVNDFHGH